MTAAAPTTSRSDRRKLMVGKGWVQGVALVVIFGFFVMGILAYRPTPPRCPCRTRWSPANGEVLFTGADITAGQELFLRPGTEEYGSVVGHGAYLGPTTPPTTCAARRTRRRHSCASPARRTAPAVDPRVPHQPLRPGHRDPGLHRQAGQGIRGQHAGHYATFFGADSTRTGWSRTLITDPADIHDLTAFFAWTAWAAAAERPGHNYSYTNNWPAEPRVDNGPTADVVVWASLSLIALLGGTGIMFAVYGRWSQKIGWHSAEARRCRSASPARWR